MTIGPLALETWLTAGSIVLATAGWLYSTHAQRQLTRRAHTFDILLSSDTTSDLSAILDEVDNRAREGPPLAASADQPIDPALRRSMNFHEFLCAAIRDGTLDGHLVRTTLRTRLLRLYDYTKDFTAALRVERKSPAAMEHLEWFALHQLDYAGWKRAMTQQNRRR
jgi:hypothetical protein